MITGTLAGASLEVEVKGVEGELRDNVRILLSVERYRDLPDLNQGLVERLHARAEGEIAQALRPFGHYAVQVEGSLESSGVDRWQARYVIEPGPRLRWRRIGIEIEGPGRAERGFAVPPRLALVPGTPMRHDAYEALKRHLRTAAMNAGYLDAAFTTQQLRADPVAGVADVRLVLQTGPRFHFGPITLRQDILQDSFLRRYLDFREGDPYSLAKLLELHYALADSEYFRVVAVEAPRDTAVDQEVPVVVNLEPRLRHRYTFGVGFATDTGPRGTVGWENRRVSTQGHRMRVGMELSEVRQAVEGRYVIPLRRPAFERLTTSVNFVNEELGDVDTRRMELALAHTVRKGRWQQTLAPRLSHARDEVGDVVERRTALVPEVEWLYRGGDSGVAPRRSQRLALQLAASDPALGAATTFLQGAVRLRAGFPLGGERDRLLLRTELGTTWASDPDRLGVAQRFFAGGDQSVRGYGYRSIGPTDADGNVIGGRHLGTASVEWEHWIREPYGVALFADAGFAADRWGSPLRTSAGIGFRWRLPFTVVALDVAHPFNHPAGRSFRFHLSLNTDL